MGIEHKDGQKWTTLFRRVTETTSKAKGTTEVVACCGSGGWAQPRGTFMSTTIRAAAGAVRLEAVSDGFATNGSLRGTIV